MKKYDFFTIPNRLESNSLKWEASKKDKDIISLSIADMDFCAFDVITNAIVELSKQQVFGYDLPKDSLFDSVIEWEKSMHDHIITKNHVTFISGVMPAISVCIEEFSKEGDEILVNTPAYSCFLRTIKLTNRKIVENSLVFKNGSFEFDFDNLENTFKNNDIKIYLFCSPHNPLGRVFKQEELLKIGNLCKKYNVLLVSDEVHRDLAIFGHKHITFTKADSSFNDFTITLISPTKTFNIAGVKNSVVIIKNEDLSKRFKKRQLAYNEHEISNIGLKVTEAVYRNGRAWLEELKSVVEDNILFLMDFFEKNIQKALIVKPEATFLVWIDFSKYEYTHSELLERFNKQKIILSDGAVFGKEGEKHFRINVGTPKTLLEEALSRIKKALE